MITTVIDRWHQFLRGSLPGGLDALLHDDCVFYSPIVFTPQRGKELTKLYLTAAGQTFPGDQPSDGDRQSSFRYVKQILDGNTAVLEFETQMGAVAVNGIDMITCDADGKITEFKVMIRPLKAVNEVHARMKAMLEQMTETS